MAISGGDGSIILTTKVDETGLKKGLGSMKKLGATAGKVFLAIGAAAATATVAITKMAVSAYADYEQLVGGVETLFKDSAGKVLEYAKDYLGENKHYEHWSFKRDGASLICRLLFEEATDINFYVGRAVNPAHQNPDLPINFNIKMNLVEELSKCLKKMGKKIKVSYF